MAYEVNIKPVSLVAAADLSAKQFYAVDIDTNGKAALVTTTGAIAAGILQDNPASGETAEVQPLGGPVISKAAAGAAFNNGAQLMVDTTGRLITATTTHGYYVIARALAAATAAGQIVPVLLAGPYYLA